MIKLKIKVTKEILEKTGFCDQGWECGNISSNCAIAVAVRDIFPTAIVEEKFIVPFFKGEKYSVCEPPDDSIFLPTKVSAFIRKFDGAQPHERPLMKELEFEIEISDEVLEQINIEEIRPLLVNHPNLELV